MPDVRVLIALVLCSGLAGVSQASAQACGASPVTFTNLLIANEREAKLKRMSTPPLSARGTVANPANRYQALQRERPVRGSRGDHRFVMRHGVSILTRGERYTLGLIFHDAE